LSDEETKKGSKSKAEDGAEGDAVEAKPKIPLRERVKMNLHPLRGNEDLWQMPTLLAGAAAVVLGVAMWIRAAPGPDFHSALDTVENRLELRQYEGALTQLNDVIAPELDDEAVTPDIKARFHTIRGDALYLGQRYKEISLDENNERIADEYAKAIEINPAALDARRSAFYAETLLALGRTGDIEALLDDIGGEFADRRLRILRTLVETALGHTLPDYERAQDLLARIMRDPTVDAELRVWSIARQNEILLAQGKNERVIDTLLVEIQRLGGGNSAVAAELFLLLGQAYLDRGDLVPARVQLARAESLAPSGAEIGGRIQVALARIAQTEGDLEDARDRFAIVTEQHKSSPAGTWGLVGLGETESDLGRHAESIRAYTTLAKRVRTGSGVAGVTAEQAAYSAEQRHRLHFASGDYATALTYAELAEQMYGPKEVPLDVIERIADTHRRAAAQALNIDPDDVSVFVDLEGTPALTLEAARAHYFQAGEYYHRHAQEAIVLDAQRAGDTLWRAADSFDRSGDIELAIKFFKDFVQTQPADARLAESRFRLGRAYQARGEFENAAEVFEQLIDAQPNSSPASRSRVPLAQCLLQSEDEADHTRAETELKAVLTGGVFAPDSMQFRDALIEIGRMYRKQGDQLHAMERLREALERYPDDPDVTMLKFDLADAYRESAADIREALREPMPQSERTENVVLRNKRLQDALVLYEQVREELSLIDERRVSDVQRQMQRNSSFYRGDCAFQLEDYDAAIRFYDTAAQRYARDPASLTAMVQIVNCYIALNKDREAETAHQRARARLDELPEDVWSSGDLPMSRDHWERWLEASVILDAS
jgi:tetratricopeptide (TPR) repeat protein